jgi:hypothetical protein
MNKNNVKLKEFYILKKLPKNSVFLYLGYIIISEIFSEL